MTDPQTEKFLTHDKSVHLDESFAFAELRLTRHLQGRDIFAVRSRDPEQANDADWVVDVGGEYDPDNHRLDHHQFRIGDEHRPTRENGIAYASAGMQWQAIGVECITEVCSKLGVEATDDLVSKVFQRIDELVMQPVDLEDNGELKTVSTGSAEGEQRPVATLLLPDLVRGLNAAVDAEYSTDKVFEQVADLMEHYLFGKIVECIEEQQCRQLMAGGERLKAKREGPEILVINEPVPKGFDSVLHEVELGVSFAVYQTHGSSEWNIRAIPWEANSFEVRLGFPEEWRGLLSTPAADRPTFADKTGLPEAIFCHAAGFCAKAGDLVTAKCLATLASGDVLRQEHM